MATPGFLATGAMDAGYTELGTLEIGGGRDITDEADMPVTITDMDIDTTGSTGAYEKLDTWQPSTMER